MAQNILSNLTKRYQKFTGSPLGQAAMISAVTIPAAYFLKNPVYRMIRGYGMARAKTSDQAMQIYNDMNQHANSWWGKWGAPIVAGSILPMASLAMNFDPDAKGFGLTSWNPYKKEAGLNKTAGLWQSEYNPTANLNTPVNPQHLTNMIRSNPLLQDSPYAMNLGASILNAAPSTGFTTTLGNVYDSAFNKFDKKLSFQGLAGTALKSVAAGSLAGMFTDVCGAMAGLPASVMKPISGDMGIITGVGTALKSILN